MSEPTVFIVDDDPAVRDSLGLLLETDGLAAESHDCVFLPYPALSSDPNPPRFPIGVRHQWGDTNERRKSKLRSTYAIEM